MLYQYLASIFVTIVFNVVNSMLRKFLIAIIILMIFSTYDSMSQKRSYPKHQFGIALSTISGIGLNYQVETSPHNALAFTFFTFYQSDAPPDDLDFYASLGIQYQFNLLKTENTRYYVAPAASFWYIEDRTFKIIRENDVITKVINKDMNRIYNFGLIGGLEHKVMDRLVVHIELGLHYQTSEVSDDTKFIDRNPSGTSFIGIGGGFGIRYAF